MNVKEFLSHMAFNPDYIHIYRYFAPAEITCDKSECLEKYSHYEVEVFNIYMDVNHKHHLMMLINL